jgi:hypothetical protein
MLTAQCVEWSLVIATALLSVPLITRLLRESFTLWKPYQKMLQAQHRYLLHCCALFVIIAIIRTSIDFLSAYSGAYRQLLRVLEREFVSPIPVEQEDKQTQTSPTHLGQIVHNSAATPTSTNGSAKQ